MLSIRRGIALWVEKAAMGNSSVLRRGNPERKQIDAILGSLASLDVSQPLEIEASIAAE
jgi:hypothetical protein